MSIDPYDGVFCTVPCPKCGADDTELDWISIKGNDLWSYPSALCIRCGYEVEMPFIRDKSDAFCRFVIITAWNRNASGDTSELDIGALEKEFNG